MNLLPSSHSRRTPTASLSPIIIPDDLIEEVLSCLTVKTLMRMRCVSKSWKSLISDSTFVKLHLHRSSPKADFTVVYKSGSNSVSFTVIRLFENPPIFFTLPNYELIDEGEQLVGSCNGLLCLVGYSRVNGGIDIESWFRFWNPATGTMSQRLGYLLNDETIPPRFTFGSDKSNNAYKVLALMHTNVRVFSLQDNAWRNIENPPVARNCSMNPVYLSGSVNWLASHGVSIIYPQFVIISFDLGSESHTQYPTPPGFDLLPSVHAPNLTVLKECLCFCHDFKQTHFVIWLMKEFGVEDSWTQFLKISYHNLLLDPFEDLVSFLVPLCLSEKNDTLLLAHEYKQVTILYSWSDNTLALGPWWCTCLNYVESLVSHC
ncbi:unnamed protein product [Lathyrus sativus]|nr:unnamed protein product [Lathyrus sativus]